jgi:hypothetical protein
MVTGAAQGIGRELVKTWEGYIPITFCRKTFTILCSFTDNNKTPLLLGKESIFDKFNITFDNNREMTLFEERKTTMVPILVIYACSIIFGLIICLFRKHQGVSIRGLLLVLNKRAFPFICRFQSDIFSWGNIEWQDIE